MSNSPWFIANSLPERFFPNARQRFAEAGMVTRRPAPAGLPMGASSLLSVPGQASLQTDRKRHGKLGEAS